MEQASSFGIKPGLERISTALTDVLGNPQEDYKIVHVTGTNGKGSVTPYISYALFTSGLRWAISLTFNPIRSVFKLMMEI